MISIQIKQSFSPGSKSQRLRFNYAEKSSIEKTNSNAVNQTQKSIEHWSGGPQNQQHL